MGQRRRNTVQSRGSVGLTPSRGSSSRLSCPPSTGHLEAAEDTPRPPAPGQEKVSVLSMNKVNGPDGGGAGMVPGAGAQVQEGRVNEDPGAGDPLPGSSKQSLGLPAKRKGVAGRRIPGKRLVPGTPQHQLLPRGRG